MLFISRFLFISLFCCIVVSCADERYEEVTIYEDLLPFHTVELNSVFDVYLIQDSSYSLRITADESLIRNIAFSIDDGILRIENTANLKWLNPDRNKVKLYITSNRLREMLPNETCSITTMNPIISEEFRIVMGHHPKLAELDLEVNNTIFYYWNNHQCGGRIRVRGNTQIFYAYTYGYMSLEAMQLSADHAIIENNSKGDCEVWVNEKIECSLRGLGNIYLYGSPNEILVHEQTSEGELIEMN